jgi:hypothetical protein
MGAIFNSQGTRAIIELLGKTFTDGFSGAAGNSNLISDLATSTQTLPSYQFATNYNLLATGSGSNSINAHWKVWLDYFDDHGGDAVRGAMAAALKTPNKYEAVEFFVYQDATFLPLVSDQKNKGSGKHSLIVTVRTPTYDQLP